MTESEIKKKINGNLAQYNGANDATKALLQAENEALAKELDAITGGVSTYDAGTGTWNLSTSNKNAVDRYLDQRELVANGAYGGYDAENDPAYKALKKSALRESDRSVEDTMGAYAGMTGGIPSTAAVTAAQEMANYYRGQLADQQVALGEQDYNRWLTQMDADRELMQLYASEAEASAANLAALGDFSALGKLYGWDEAQIAEAEKQWLASQRSGGGGGRGSSKKKDEVEVDGVPDYVLGALGYGEGGGIPTGSGPMTKKGTTSNQVNEQAVYQKVQQIVKTMPTAQAWQVVNNSFSGTEKEAAVQMFKELKG